MDALLAAIRRERRAMCARFLALDAAYAAGLITTRELNEAMAMEGFLTLGTLAALEATAAAA